MLVEVLVDELLGEREVGRLGDDALLVEHGDDAQRLLDQLDARLQVQPEVDERPRNAFALVLLLLQHEHVVVEELLQALIHEVDPQLLEAVELKARGRP